MSDSRNGHGPKDFKFVTQISIGQIGIMLSVVVSALVFYFSGQSAVGDRITKVESDMSQRLNTSIDTLGDRISKLETRVAVIEQHQTAEDAATADNRTQLNSFAVEVRGQLGRISDQIAELRPLIQAGQHDNGQVYQQQRR